ncbi:MAG: alpha/beta hydrolase [Thermoleophilia bacterium]
MVVPGLGSRRANHADFARAVAAAGMAALTLDLRGHGDSGGELDGGAAHDVAAALDALAARGHGPLGLRGSSMGGLLALHAAASDERVAAVVAICPARGEALAARIGADWPRALRPAPAAGDPRRVARGLWHATGDAQVPWAGTMALAGRLPPPVRLRVAMGGGHNTLQHDPAVIAETVAFLREHLAGP